MTKDKKYLIIVLLLFMVFAWAKEPQIILGLNLPSTSVELAVALHSQHLTYVSVDPFYFELGLGYKYYFAGNAFGQQQVAAFTKAEIIYSFNNFKNSNVSIGLEVSPNGKIVGGFELLTRPLKWNEQLPYTTGWRFVMLLIPRIVAEYRIPLSW